MIYIKLFLLIALFLSGCAPTQVATMRTASPTTEQKEVAQQKEIVVEEGTFLLRDLSLDTERYLDPKLKGDVINNTTKDWNEVVFEIELYGQMGNKLKGYIGKDFTFQIYNIKKGEMKSIGMGYGESFLGLRGTIISKYEIRFKSGEYPAKYIFVMVKPKESKEVAFEDSFMSIEFSISKRQVGFVLRNKTDNPIKIDWDQVSYVDVLGESHKVMHSGVRYIERDKPQAPTVVPPTAKVEDMVFPSDYVYYSSGEYGGWREIPLFPEAPAAKIYKGSSFSIFMPLEVNGVVKNYIFTFKIEDVII